MNITLSFLGSYAYFEASSPARKGHSAKLYSPKYKVQNEVCISLWYHAYGKAIGKLSISVTNKQKEVLKKLWAVSGNVFQTKLQCIQVAF